MTEPNTQDNEDLVALIGTLIATNQHPAQSYTESLGMCAYWNKFDEQVRKRLRFQALQWGQKEGVTSMKVHRTLPPGYGKTPRPS